MRKKMFGSASEKQRAYRERQAALRLEAKALRLAKKGLNVTESVTIEPNVTDVVVNVTPVNVEWDKEKYPDRRAWEVAVVRVERAVRYAGLFPEMIHAGDEVYQDLGWQYEHEGLPAVRKRETASVN